MTDNPYSPQLDDDVVIVSNPKWTCWNEGYAAHKADIKDNLHEALAAIRSGDYESAREYIGKCLKEK